MQTPFYFHHREPGRVRNTQSSALILALFFIGLISILVIGFLASMQTETFSAHSHLYGVEADIYADAGVDLAVGKLYTALYSPLQGSATSFNPTNYWISQPGRIFTSTASDTYATNYDLSSGGWGSGTAPTSDQGVDLNPVSFEGGGRIVSYTNGDMYVQWIYQHQDGTLDPASPPVYKPSNPVVGRFAYWVDDEGAKINLNTAWDRTGNANALSHPSRINLEALAPADATAIYNYRSAGSNFNSVVEVGRVPGISTSTLQNKFSLTAYNHSPDLNMTNAAGTPLRPDLNMFGEQRIMLTTQKRYADAVGCTNFLDILATENTDPGNYAALSLSGVHTTVIKLNAALNRTDFPFAPGKSFLAKYGASSTPITAINIIDYVRSAESINQFIEPIRGDANGTGFTIGSTPNYIGATISNCGRRPYLTATGVVLINYTNSVATFGTLASVYVPPVIPGGNNNDIAINAATLYMYDFLERTSPQPVDNALAGSIGNANGLSADGLIHGGQYATLVHNWTGKETSKPASLSDIGNLAVPAYAGTHINFKLVNAVAVSISYPGNQHPAVATPSSVIPISSATNAADPTVTAYGIIDDPAGGTWPVPDSPLLTPANFGTPWTHVTTLGHAPAAITPLPDTDASGLVANGMFVPAPKGTASNPSGVVYSVGELGFIPTSFTAKSINWRTVRLQPQKQTGVLPDWALLDLFTVPQIGPAPSASDQPYLEPYNTTPVPYAGGKININNAAYQLADSTTGNQLFRPLPLQALLLGETNTYPDPTAASPTPPTTIGTSLAATLATNIAWGLPAANGTIYGTNAVANSTNLYWSPYQLAEIKGVADGGEGSEVIFRQLSGLMTTRSDVFTIYTVGQAIRQSSSGITILGERRKQATVERFVNTSGAVVLQPVSSKDLQP